MPLFISFVGGSPINANAGNSVNNLAGVYQRFDEDVNLPLVKVVVLGAPGVGKTSVVKVGRLLVTKLILF